VVRRTTVHRAVLTVSVVALGSGAFAQGLGAVAKKTEEQQKASTSTPLVISKLPPAPRDSGPVRVTADVLDQYLRGRLALADLRRADKPLDRRVHTAVTKAKHYDDLGPFYASEQSIVDLLSTFNITTTDYLYVEAALIRAQDYAQYPKQLSMDRLSGRDRENIEFLKANIGVVNDIRERCRAADRGLIFWNIIPAVH